MPADPTNVARLPAAQRSRLSNGSAVLPGVDGRSERARRLRDLIAEHIADLTGGGDAAELSEAQRSLCRRCATIELQLEALETRFASDGEASARDLDLYGRLTGHLRRALETLGVRPRRERPAASIRDRLMAG